MVINAYAAFEPGGQFEHFSYDPGEIGPHEVEIEVRSCGVCHSDLSMWQNEWGGIAEYPFVGGHEIAGVVASVGNLVENVKAGGDKVGLGWQKGYCNTCNQCLVVTTTFAQNNKVLSLAILGGASLSVCGRKTLA